MTRPYQYSSHNLGWFIAIALGVLLAIFVDQCSRDNSAEAAEPCRAPGFVLTGGTVQQHRPAEFSIGELTLTAPPEGVVVTVLLSLSRGGQRYHVIAVPAR